MSILLNGRLKVEIFGESHGPCIGATVDGFPAGVRVDLERIQAEMQERSAGAVGSTPRREPDRPEFLSGIYRGVTTGAAICLSISNTNVRSSDYETVSHVARPSHADYPAHVRYRGFEDPRGGGAFSGRLTAPMVAVGALCRHWLEQKKVSVSARIREIAGIPVDAQTPDALPECVRETLTRLSASKNSCGGIISGSIKGLPPGLGGLMAESIESRLSSLLFAVPAVKGVSFGLGFGFASRTAQDCNDAYVVQDGTIHPATNFNGGVLGGLTTGADVDFSVVFKPVPSIAAPQKSVDLLTMQEVELEIKGRHDVCIVVRAVPVVRAVAAMAAVDFLLEAGI